MNGFRFNKLFVAVVIQVGVLTILMIFLVRRHMTAPSSGDRLSSVSHQGPLQRRCSSRLPGHMTSLKQVTNAMNSKSLGQLAVSPTDETDAKFLIKYEAFCQANLRPKASNVFVIPSEFDDCLCPCVPSGLGTFTDSFRNFNTCESG